MALVMSDCRNAVGARVIANTVKSGGGRGSRGCRGCHSDAPSGSAADGGAEIAGIAEIGAGNGASQPLGWISAFSAFPAFDFRSRGLTRQRRAGRPRAAPAVRLAEALRRTGCAGVYATDIVDCGQQHDLLDFTSERNPEIEARFDAIVTNPPFG